MLQYDELPPHTRLWIYPANRKFSAEEVAQLSRKLEEFAEAWTSHRRNLEAHLSIRDHRFLIVAVDEAAAQASGCSIDASVQFVRQLGTDHNVDFFDRLTFYVQEEDEWTPYPSASFAEAYANGRLTDLSIVADPLVTTKAAADQSFAKPIADSWHVRFV